MTTSTESQRVFLFFFKNKKTIQKKKVEKKSRNFDFFQNSCRKNYIEIWKFLSVTRLILKWSNFRKKNHLFPISGLTCGVAWVLPLFYAWKMAIWGCAPPFLGRGGNIIFFSRSAILSSFTWYKSHFCISNRYLKKKLKGEHICCGTGRDP